jgi:hypothetical protein
MYDEFERNVTGRARRRHSAGTWILLGLAGFVLTGVAASVAGFFIVRREVVRVVERIEADPTVKVSAALKALEGLAALDVTSTGARTASDALTAAAMFERLDPELGMALPDPGSRVVVPAGEAVADMQDRTAAVRGDLDVGELVEGGSLTIRTRKGEVRLGAGDYAVTPPSWLPALAGRPDQPRHVFSAQSPEGSLGAVAWTVDESPERVVETYRSALRDAGFELRVEGEHRTGRRANRQEGATLLGEFGDGDRHVFVVASHDHEGRTGVLLGYHERR